jgi:hypothetical protein
MRAPRASLSRRVASVGAMSAWNAERIRPKACRSGGSGSLGVVGTAFIASIPAKGPAAGPPHR